MHKSSIKIDILLDPDKVPESIHWKASDSSAEMGQKAKAMCIAFWDPADKTAMRIDLWTKDMMVDEMGEFFYQMLFTMSDTFKRATKNAELAAEMKSFSEAFIKKFRAAQVTENGV
ncbi:MAG: gliding motility protein GldC [Ferruginibacter sp.]|nr:gliding motility protein GldC [Ferruginibacter sp.]